MIAGNLECAEHWVSRPHACGRCVLSKPDWFLSYLQIGSTCVMV